MKQIVLEKKGITLIALIITIIVLLILAGITISLVVGDNGILTQSKSSSEKTIIGREKELSEGGANRLSHAGRRCLQRYHDRSAQHGPYRVEHVR